MVVVNCPLMQNDIIKIVEGISINNKSPFKFTEKKGMKIFFETIEISPEEACVVIKSEIRKSPLGSVLNFNVVQG